MPFKDNGDLDLDPAMEVFSTAAAVAATVLGVGLIALAVVTDVRWGWTDIWPAVFLEVGAAIGLLAALLVLERRIVRVVRRPPTLPVCTLASPPSQIHQVGVLDIGTIYGCDHEPEHRWDLFGRRIADFPGVHPDRDTAPPTTEHLRGE